MNYEKQLKESVLAQLTQLSIQIATDNGAILLRLAQGPVESEYQWKEGEHLDQVALRQDLFSRFAPDVPWGDGACLLDDENEFQDTLQDILAEIDMLKDFGYTWFIMITVQAPENERDYTPMYRFALASNGQPLTATRNYPDLWNTSIS